MSYETSDIKPPKRYRDNSFRVGPPLRVICLVGTNPNHNRASDHCTSGKEYIAYQSKEKESCYLLSVNDGGNVNAQYNKNRFQVIPTEFETF